MLPSDGQRLWQIRPAVKRSIQCLQQTSTQAVELFAKELPKACCLHKLSL